MEMLKNMLFYGVENGDYSQYCMRRIKNAVRFISDKEISEEDAEDEFFDFYEREIYTATDKERSRRAALEDGRKAFGYNGSFTIRDGIYRKDESRVSGALNGIFEGMTEDFKSASG